MSPTNRVDGPVEALVEGDGQIFLLSYRFHGERFGGDGHRP
jgi:hypothetical protein